MDEVALTPRQREVVECDDDLVMVLGGAGSGKTTTALWAARTELLRQESGLSRVAFLTFSRTAVDQIVRRSGKALAGTRDRVEISTFHGFAYRLVRAFSRYCGLGPILPELQSPSQIKLNGTRPDLLAYDDLLPLAIDVLGSQRIRELLATRWPLIICDEFQDTSDDHWELLELLRSSSRLLLLADPNQMIYTFMPGVGPQRLQQAHALADRVVELEAASHRDPSGAVPALAKAVSQRDFEADAVTAAVQAGRLIVRTDVEDAQLIEVISAELQDAWRAGAQDYGIFGQSNEGVALMGHDLAEAGIDHVLVGLTDAQAEALAAMSVMCQFAIGQASVAQLRIALATFITACSRGSRAPQLAIALARGNLPRPLEQRVDDLALALTQAAPDFAAVAQAVEQSWPSLGILNGSRPWARAIPTFTSTFRAVLGDSELTPDFATAVETEIRRVRTSALLDSSRSRQPPTQLMNFHQTKGREADAVILVYRSGDVLAHWQDEEPFDEPSRVLYVALTRARQRITVILPSDPHPVVAPFASLG